MGDDEECDEPVGCDPENCCCSTCTSRTDDGCPFMEFGEQCPGVGFTCAGHTCCPFIDYPDEEE